MAHTQQARIDSAGCHGIATITAITLPGDAQLRDLPNTTVVGPALEPVKAFFEIQELAAGRDRIRPRRLAIIDILGIPGHDAASIALYDRQTGILLTGDTVYPGRLYVREAPCSSPRVSSGLIDFTKGKPVTHVLGTHIEQSGTPFVDYPVGSMFQPNEHLLQLTRGNAS